MSRNVDPSLRSRSITTRRLTFLLGMACCFLLPCAPLFASAGFPVRYVGTLTALANGTAWTPQGVAFDLSGNVYVSDTGGGSVLKVAPNGATTPVAISGATLTHPMGLTVDSSGNLYIADVSQVVKVTPSGTGSVVSTQSLTLSGAYGVAVDAAGDIFVSDTYNNRIVEIAAGGTASVLATTSGTSLTSLSSPEGVAVDLFGNLYVVDTGNNRVVEVTPSRAGTVLTTSGTLNAPVAVSVGMNGNVYIVDGPSNVRIAVVSPDGDAYDLFFDEVNADLGIPSAIAVSPMGTVYLADIQSNGVKAFQVDTAGFPSVFLGSSGTPQTLRFVVSGTVTVTGVAAYTMGVPDKDFTTAANSGTDCSSHPSGTNCTVNVQFTPTAAGLRRGALVLSYSVNGTSNPTVTGSLAVPLFGYGNAPVAALSPGVASVVNVGSVPLAGPFQTARDGAGNIYVSNYQNSTLVKVPAGGGSGSIVNIPALPNPTTISNPTGLAIDGAGNLFVSDYNNNRIVEVDPAGTISKVIAIRGLSSGPNYPTALNFTANGRLLVNDFGRGRILLLSPDIYDNNNNDGDGTVGYAAGYVLPQGSYTLPIVDSTSLSSDAVGNVYYAERSGNSVIKLDPLGTVSLVSLPSTALNSPQGVAVDPLQNLYVLDSGNKRVIQQNANGSTSVLQYSGPGFSPTAFGVDVDGSGNVLIADFDNNRLILDNVSQSALTFPSINRGDTSSAIATAVTNLGDQPLVFSANPTYTVNFSQATSDPNPCTSDTILSAGESCDVPIVFSPQTSGSLSATIRITDDALNLGGATQQIAVSGTAINPGDVTSTTKTSPSGASYSYGQPITVSVQVKDLTDTSIVPTGSVTFTDSLTSTIQQVGLDSGGNATWLSNNVLSGIGTHNITASYGAVAGAFLASSTTFSIAINKDTVAVTGPNQVPVTRGQSGSAAITVAPTVVNGSFAAGAALPSGTISYSILSGSNAVVGPTTATLTAGSGNASAVVAIPNTLDSGSYTISVSYAGDGNYEASSAISIPLRIAQITPTIAWTPASSITYGTNLGALLTATASTGNTVVPGTFTYTAALSGSAANAVISASVLGAGTYTLTATFVPTDTITYTTKSMSAMLTVGKAAAALSLAANANPAVLTSAVSFTAGLSSPIGAPTGTINFYDGTILLGAVPVTNLQAVYTTSSLAVGTHSITASYAGDGNFASTTSSAVTELVQDFTLSTPGSGSAGTPSATVVPGGVATFTLNIGPSIGTVFPAPVTLSLAGLPPGATGTLSPTSLPAGSSLSTVTLTIQLPQTAQAERTDAPLRSAPLLLGLLMLPFARKWRRAGKKLGGITAGLLLLAGSAIAMMGVSGCASGNGFFSQAPQTYTIQIIATSGNLSHSTSVTLTVQ